MAKGGFLRRIGRALENFGKALTGQTPQRHAPPPRPEPEPTPEPTGSDYRRIWRRRNGKGDYQKHLRTFHRVVDPVEPDPNEQLELWESYVENIVSPSRRKARRQSTQNLFWRDSGIDPADFNWQSWREAMGYTGKKRSRTP